MLDLAQRKAVEHSLEDRIEFIEADAAELPFPDGHFDDVGIALAFRNLTYRNPSKERCLAELVRVIRTWAARKFKYFRLDGVLSSDNFFLKGQ